VDSSLPLRCPSRARSTLRCSTAPNRFPIVDMRTACAALPSQERNWDAVRARSTGAATPLAPRLSTQSILLARVLLRRQELGEARRARIYRRAYGPPVPDSELGDSHFQAVERIPQGCLTPEIMAAVLRTSVPVVLEGAAIDCPAVQNWTPEYLAKQHGDIPVPTFREHTGTYTMTMAECMRHILQEESSEVQINNACDVLQAGEGLLDQLPLEAMARRAPSLRYHGANLFVCGAGGGSKYHCANEVNFFFQVHGEKEWNFIHPRYTSLMDPKFTLPRCSYFGSGIPWGEHPRGVPIARVVLKPGDVLVNPPWWWHWVRNRTTTIGVATRWRSWRHRFGTENAYFSGLQWLFPHQWKIMWNDYVRGGHLNDAKWVHRDGPA
jgi:hypothetical protein